MSNTEKLFQDGERPNLVLVKNSDIPAAEGTEDFEDTESAFDDLPEEDAFEEDAGEAFEEDYDPEEYESDEEYEEYPEDYDAYDESAGDYDEYDEYADYPEYDDASGEGGEEGSPEPADTPPAPPAPQSGPEGENDGNKKNQTAKARKKGFFRRHLKLFIIILLIIIAAAVGVCFFLKNRSAKAMSELPMQNFSMVERMDISNSIAVTGTVSAKKTRNVSTLVSNTKVKSVSVKVGDYVEVGDPICTFDTTNIEEKISRLQKQVYVATSKSVLNQMEANTKLAWTLEDAFETAEEKREKVEAARRSYDAAERDLGEKEKQLEEAEEKYEDDDSDENEKNVRQAKLAVQSAKDQVASAVDSYNDAVRAQIDDTENSVRTISQNQEAILNTGLDGMTTNDSSNTELDELNRQLSNCVVTAPLAGLVTSVSVEVGEEYSEKSTICVIQDDSVYLVTGTVDQYDISQIEEGQSAMIKTEATGDDELSGTVTFVAPVPQSSSSGTTNTSNSGGTTGTGSSSAEYSIEITLDGKDDRLRLGMTAETSVLTAKRENVLAVPYDCVVEEGDENVVYVATDTMSSGGAGAGFSEPSFDEESESAAQSSGDGSNIPGPPLGIGSGRPGPPSGGGGGRPAPPSGAGAGRSELPSGDEGPSGKAVPSGDEEPSKEAAPSEGEEPLEEAEPSGDEELSEEAEPSKPGLFTRIKEAVTGFVKGLISSDELSETAQRPTKRVVVEKGLETDYYIEIISDELSEGDEVLVSESDMGGGFDMGFGGPF